MTYRDERRGAGHLVRYRVLIGLDSTQEGPEREAYVATMLRDLADRVERWGVDAEVRTLIDTNGNGVGSAWLELDR